MKRNSITYKTSLSVSLIMTLTVHLFFFIIFFFGRDTFFPSGGPPHPRQELDIYRTIYHLITNFILLFVLFSLNFKILTSHVKYKWFTIITGTLFALLFINALFGIIQYYLFSYEYLPPVRAIIGRMLGECLIGMIVIFVSQIIYLSVKRQESELKNKELHAENMKSKYEALKNQLDPHFLFNTLSSLDTLIQLNPQKAQQYLHQLSSVFRYTLQNKETATLEDELKFTADYCQLMQIRYGDNLTFNFDIKEHYKPYHLVPLSIQTLIENAIKHNIISNKDPLTITIKSVEQNTIQVSNPIQKKLIPEAGQGIGLANLAERYRLKWNKEIQITNKDNQFQVTIPLINP